MPAISLKLSLKLECKSGVRIRDLRLSKQASFNHSTRVPAQCVYIENKELEIKLAAQGNTTNHKKKQIKSIILFYSNRNWHYHDNAMTINWFLNLN